MHVQLQEWNMVAAPAGLAALAFLVFVTSFGSKKAKAMRS